MKFVDDSDTVRTTILNTDIKLAVDAKATSPVPVPLEITEIFIQNFTLQLDLATTSDEEQLIWQVQEGLHMTLDNVNMTVKEKFWQKHLVDKIQPAVMKAITYGLNFVDGAVKGIVE